jgi:aminoglycoside 6'-N-acetyltransferase I
MNILCRRVTHADFEEWLRLGLKLWPDATERDLRRTFRGILRSRKETAILCRFPGGSPVGFANVSLRTDYVEGSDSSPVGYLEGIFVESNYRGRGIGKRLAREAEEWARKKGCREMGSDAELTNTKSHAFHRAIGFREANRIVSYIKKIRK